MDNGNYVTRAELKAHVTPMQADITEIKADVKSLLAERAEETGAERVSVRFSSRMLAIGTICVAALGPIVTAVMFALQNH